MEVNGRSNSFIILKNHQENVLNHPTAWFINEVETETRRIEHISKQINGVNAGFNEELNNNDY